MGARVRTCGEVSGVCAVCVGMAAVLKKEQNVDSARNKHVHVSILPFPLPCPLFTCQHFNICTLYLDHQLQKTGPEMASGQEPRQQGRS